MVTHHKIKITMITKKIIMITKLIPKKNSNSTIPNNIHNLLVTTNTHRTQEWARRRTQEWTTPVPTPSVTLLDMFHPMKWIEFTAHELAHCDHAKLDNTQTTNTRK